MTETIIKLIIVKGVCRTASATLGLLKSISVIHPIVLVIILNRAGHGLLKIILESFSSPK